MLWNWTNSIVIWQSYSILNIFVLQRDHKFVKVIKYLVFPLLSDMNFSQKSFALLSFLGRQLDIFDFKSTNASWWVNYYSFCFSGRAHSSDCSSQYRLFVLTMFCISDSSLMSFCILSSSDAHFVLLLVLSFLSSIVKSGHLCQVCHCV